VSEASLFVTDYKSSREVPGLAKFERQGRVQAILYAAAAESLLGLPVSGSAYRSMTSRQVRGVWRRDLLGETPPGACPDDGTDERGFADLVARTEEMVAGAVDGMRAGHIPRTPMTPGACIHCAISGVCEGARR